MSGWVDIRGVLHCPSPAGCHDLLTTRWGTACSEHYFDRILMQEFESIRNNWDDMADGDLARAVALKPEASPGAETELYRRFARRVRLYGIRHLGDEDAAQDLSHDVMIKAIQKLRTGEVREPDRIGSFVLGVARMMVHEQYRKRSREEQWEDIEKDKLSVETFAPDRLASDLLKKCLKSLAERERAILLLTYYAEQSSKRIAESLGLEVGNVRVIRHRGIANLRDCLGVDKEAGR